MLQRSNFKREIKKRTLSLTVLQKDSIEQLLFSQKRNHFIIREIYIFCARTLREGELRADGTKHKK